MIAMKFIKKSWYRLIFTFFAFIFPVISFAQAKIDNPIDVDTINELIKVLLEGVLQIGFPLVALAIIYCGFLFVKARGKPEEITKAKDALLYTIIGAAILLGSWAIAQLISETVINIK